MVKKINIYDKNIYFFGCGAVAKATLYHMPKFFKLDFHKVKIFDKMDYKKHPVVKYYLKKGANYFLTDLNKSYVEIIKELKPYDIIIDLTDTTNSVGFLENAYARNVHYVNTSIESEFSSKVEMEKHKGFDGTYESAHLDCLKIAKKYPKSSATCVLETGMNPGLISSLTKDAILFLAKNVKNKSDALKTHIKDKNFNLLCSELKIEIIHCSEIDTSDFNEKKKLKVFSNTWCCNGILSEGSVPSEFAWGSHEKEMPPDSVLLYDNIIQLQKRPALTNFVQSFVPIQDKPMIGCVIPHGEGVSLASYLRCPDGYSPTINYAYLWSPITQQSFKKFINKKNIGDDLPSNKTHVINNYDDHDFYGIDAVGCLLVTQDKRSVWCGSILDNVMSDKYSSGTLQQVAMGVISGLAHIIQKNANQKIIFPEAMDHEFILKMVKPYLGEYYCDFVDYAPSSNQWKDIVRSKADFDKQFE